MITARFLGTTIEKPVRPAYVYSRSVVPNWSEAMSKAEVVSAPENVEKMFVEIKNLHTVLTDPETGEVLEHYNKHYGIRTPS